MAYMRFNYRSVELGYDVDISVTYPTANLVYYDPATNPRTGPGAQGPDNRIQYKPGMKFQTVYVTPCSATDDTGIFHYTNIEQFADDNCVMLVVPKMVNSMGVDMYRGFKYSTFLTEELPTVIQTLFASSPKREDNFIVGRAAGGSAALYNAVRHPELYSAVVDMSGGIGNSFDPENVKRFPMKTLGVFPPFEEYEGSKYDMNYLTKKNIEEGKPLPKCIFIRGGEEGGIGLFVDKEAELARKLGYEVEHYNVPGGTHTDYFWNEQWKLIFDQYLPLKRAPIYD